MPSQPLNGAQIIAKFELYVDDNSELSSSEELDILNKVYDDILSDRPWEFLKKNASDVAINTSGVVTIPVPADFRYFSINYGSTDNSVQDDLDQARRVIYMGSSLAPYKVINFGDRRRYYNQVGYCFFDPVTNVIQFTAVPSTDTLAYDFDYIFSPAPITLTTFPVFPAEYHDIIYHGMAFESTIVNLFDRAKSYSKENQASYMSGMKQLQYYNAQLQQN